MDQTEALLTAAQNAAPQSAVQVPAPDGTVAILQQAQNLPIDPKAFSTDVGLPQPDPSTTASGVLGSFERGAGPYAAGALVGAGLGSILPGPGTVAGAGLGAATVGIGDLGYGVYNAIAPHVGAPHVAGPSESFNRLLDYTNIPRPGTPLERIMQAAGAGVGAGVSAPAAASSLYNPASNSAGNSLLKTMTQNPGLQAASGTASGLAGQSAKESGLNPAWQYGASLLASLAPFGPRAGINWLASAEPKPGVSNAVDAGYTVPPNTASNNPTVLSSALSAIGGKVKTNQVASMRNQDVTNGIAATELGLPQDTELTPSVIQQVRTGANSVYDKVAQMGGHLDPNTDPQYINDVAQLGGRSSAAAQAFPNTWKNSGIDDLQDDLLNGNGFDTQAALDQVRKLRADANISFRSDDPAKGALGIAQRQGADALDGLIQRNLNNNPQTASLARQYTDARTLLAKTYDVEAALNPATGNVKAARIGTLLMNGKPMTGGLQTIGNAALAFPKATQNPDTFGGGENWSVLDAAGAAGAAVSGHPAVAAGIVARPLLRSTILSPGYQNAMMGRGATDLPASLLGFPANQVLNAPNDKSKRPGSPLISALMAPSANTGP